MVSEIDSTEEDMQNFMDEDMVQYMGLFVQEMRDHIQNLNECLITLEKDPENEIGPIRFSIKAKRDNP